MSDETDKSHAKFKYKPLFLIDVGAMKTRDLKRAEKECGICIVECKTPHAVRLLEPPFDADIDTQARASLALSRYIVSNGQYNSTFIKGDLLQFFVRALCYEPPVPPVARVKKS